jgi:hypothetical protein
MKAVSAQRAVNALAGGLLLVNTAFAQTPEPTAIKYPDATASPAVKAAFSQALEKCQTEVREDYANKMAKAVADGKPQFVAILERRREEALVSLCQLTADNAAADQRIAANRADIAADKLAAADKVALRACGDGQRALLKAVKSDDLATLLDRFKAVDVKVTAGETDDAMAELNYFEACYLFFQLRKRTESEGVVEALYRTSRLVDMALSQTIAADRAEIAANRALGALLDDSKRIADKITSNTATPKDIADLQRTHQALKDMNTARPFSGTLQVIQLLDGVLAKYKRLQ